MQTRHLAVRPANCTDTWLQMYWSPESDCHLALEDGNDPIMAKTPALSDFASEATSGIYLSQDSPDERMAK